MSIAYKKTKRIKPGTKGRNKKYYATLVNSGYSDINDILTVINSKTRLHPADFIKMLYALHDAMIEELSNGKIIRLGPLGNFRLGIKSKGHVNARDVNPESIIEVNILYNPCKKIKETIKDFTFYEQL